jgi:hypothetical protein
MQQPVAIKDQIDNYRRSKMVKGCGMRDYTKWYPANELHVDDFDKMISEALGRFQIKLTLEDLCTYASDEGRRFNEKVTQAWQNTIASTLFYA